MKIIPLLLLLNLLLFFPSCQSSDSDPNESIEVIVSFSELQSIMDADKSKTWLINFWATSCPPCLKEMPHFNKLEKEFQDKNLKILLVSLDRSNTLESRVYPFVKKLQITPEVCLLDDQNYSSWTDAVDKSWYGALPATWIVNGEKENFKFGLYESYEELLKDVNKTMIK